MALETNNPFWQFSLRVYASQDVAAECLELQDKLGLDVNIVLFAAWLGAARGIALDRNAIDRIAQEMESWSDAVVRPLRAVRQRLKQMPQIIDPQVQALRKKIADAELFSEQIEQALLYRLAGGLEQAMSEPGPAAARANVLAILAAHGGDPAAFPLQSLLAAVNSAADPASRR
jgi:uncharacterized protein (TIGR02444 family)